MHLESVKTGEIQGFDHLDKAVRFPVDRVVEEVKVGEYAALVIPGGVANPDALRQDSKAVAFVRAFFEADKPVAAICHAAWLLVEADVVRGRTLTSWPSLKTDIRNAGGDWVDQAVVVDEKLVTSRKPADLPQFNAKVVSLFSSAAAERAVDRMSERSVPASDPPPGPTSIGA